MSIYRSVFITTIRNFIMKPPLCKLYLKSILIITTTGNFMTNTSFLYKLYLKIILIIISTGNFIMKSPFCKLYLKSILIITTTGNFIVKPPSANNLSIFVSHSFSNQLSMPYHFIQSLKP